MVCDWTTIMVCDWSAIMVRDWTGITVCNWTAIMVCDWTTVMVCDWSAIMVCDWTGIMVCDWTAIMVCDCFLMLQCCPGSVDTDMSSHRGTKTVDEGRMAAWVNVIHRLVLGRQFRLWFHSWRGRDNNISNASGLNNFQFSTKIPLSVSCIRV